MKVRKYMKQMIHYVTYYILLEVKTYDNNVYEVK